METVLKSIITTIFLYANTVFRGITLAPTVVKTVNSTKEKVAYGISKDIAVEVIALR